MLNLANYGRVLRAAITGALVMLVAACAQTQPDGLQGNGVAPGTGQDFVVNVGDRVFFDEDQSTLNAAAQSTLSKQAAWLGRYSKYTITVEGHADERGTRQYNIALGARRAQSARDYLVSQGVPASRIKTISYGKERPVAVCNDSSCWTQNRRAVTVLNNATQ
ncbi:MAG: peptidoglycan-associated lipoprotein Pal [Rhodobacteraceae bacterium]|nr:peptidoglycan-associated lipoprotein Pal [Paracoccaceae bacterium]